MTMSLLTTRCALGALGAAAAVAATFFSTPQAQAAPPKPHVTARQAEAAAVRRIPGQALSAKYEFEDGHWQYAVLVKSGKGQLYEAEVSALTGQVTASEKTSAAEEATEAAADQKAALKAKGHGRQSRPAASQGDHAEKSDAAGQAETRK